MTRELLFSLVSIGSFAIPLSFALTLVALPRPRSSIVRSIVAIVAAWISSVAYTIYVYNPTGIAAGHELGWDSPEMRFDNNAVASQLVGGWIFPTVTVMLFFALRHLRRRAARNAKH